MVKETFGSVSCHRGAFALGTKIAYRNSVSSQEQGFFAEVVERGGVVEFPSKTRLRWKNVLVLCVLSLLLGCQQVSFEPIDRQGHVVIKQPNGTGYCFKVPKDWEIRENLEGSDVACMGPLKHNFRETIVAKSLADGELSTDPEAFLKEQLGAKADPAISFTHKVIESSDEDKPMVVEFLAQQISSQQTGQLLYLHRRSEGGGVLFTCTTRLEDLKERRSFFEEIIAKAKYDLADCGGPGGVPDDFPTPEVIYSPSPTS